MEKGAWRGRWGPLSSLNKLKVQIKLTCSICSWSVLSLAGAGRKAWVAGGFADCLEEPQPCRVALDNGMRGASVF